MGPEATAELFFRIIRRTPARCDEDHLRVIIDSNPQIPDRSTAILDGGADPRPALCATARNLERAGADFIAIPCNTVHYYWGEIQRAVAIPVIDMIATVAACLRESRVGLLATESTVRTGLYQHACARQQTRLLMPDKRDQQALMDLIWSIKAGEHDPGAIRNYVEIGRRLMARGAQALIVGCTELSLLPSLYVLDVPIYDALAALAEHCVELAQSPGDAYLTEVADPVPAKELEYPQLTNVAVSS
jgi:aspartate racemase